VLASVYRHRVVIRTVPFAELFHASIRALVTELGIPVAGGGWVGRRSLFRLAVDWARDTLRFTLHTGEVRDLDFQA
jgi:hypothetical protein